MKSQEGVVTEGEKAQKYGIAEAQWEECVKEGEDSCQILWRDQQEWGTKRDHKFQSYCVLISILENKSDTSGSWDVPKKQNETTQE